MQRQPLRRDGEKGFHSLMEMEKSRNEDDSFQFQKRLLQRTKGLLSLSAGNQTKIAGQENQDGCQEIFLFREPLLPSGAAASRPNGAVQAAARAVPFIALAQPQCSARDSMGGSKGPNHPMGSPVLPDHLGTISSPFVLVAILRVTTRELCPVMCVKENRAAIFNPKAFR